MIFPDHARGWVFRAAGAARKLLKEKKFDVVISSGPPHSAHLAALLATRGQRTPFWIDMRDPWSLTHAMHVQADWLVRAERFALRRLERLVFPRAKRVIVNTREFAAALRSDEPTTDVVHFPNGIDLEQLPTRDLSKVEHGSIAHVGTLYANRDLSSLLAAMGGVLRDRPSSAVALRLRVVGALESPHRERMHSEIDSAGLQAFVDICGSLPRSEAVEVLSRSHLALVLAQDQPMCVPAKLYEAVGLGIPTLVVAEEGSAAACEARRLGAMTLEDGDVAGLRRVLEDLLAGGIATRIESKTPISYEALAGQMHRLLLDGMNE
jgi:glycosyltransferase involved in cell wall biosynthesis